MSLRALAFIIGVATAAPIWANYGDDAKKDNSRQTRTSVEALANSGRIDLKLDTKPGVRALANVRRQFEEQSQADETQPSITEPSRSGRPASTRPDTYPQGERRQNRANAEHGRQFGAVSRPFSAYQWGGFGPANQWGGFAPANQWGGFVPPNQWGFMPNGANFNQVNGFRQFGFPPAFASGGFGFGYGNPYLVPNYYGFGFTPIVFGLSGPVVVRYDDPLRRQWKQVDDGIRKMAEGK
jgi:hypothetical protein